jgi:hypothetical protein
MTSWGSFCTPSRTPSHPTAPGTPILPDRVVAEARVFEPGPALLVIWGLGL